MDTIPSNELAEMRTAVQGLMRSTCSIVQAVNTVDGQGGVVQAWGTLSSGVPCRLDRTSTGSEMIVADARQFSARYTLTLPYDTVVAEEDRVVIGAHTYTVLATNNDQTDLIVKRLEVERVF